MELSQQEVNDWRKDPVTKKVFARIQLVENDATEMLINGVQSYDYARGLIAGLRMLQNIEGDEVDGNKE